jgi:TetR/AcrR family transcriptional regulator, tetracycline repressor protein
VQPGCHRAIVASGRLVCCGQILGVAGMMQTRKPGESARRLDRLSRSLLAEAGLAKAPAAAAHTVLFTYLLGSVTMEELRSVTPAGRDTGHAAARFRSGLDVIIAGIQASAVW